MQNYHKHTCYSNIYNADSTATYEDYIHRCKELGHKVISSVEHGWQSNYYVPFTLVKENNDKYKQLYDEHKIDKQEYKKNLLKFVFGTEAYWVKDREIIQKHQYRTSKGKIETKESKDRTNCHIVILAKNENGREAINDILAEANISGYYFRPRIDLSLIFSLPKDDVFITSACIAGWKYDDAEDIYLKIKIIIQTHKKC